MGSSWFENVKSSIPRGFSRFYVIQLLKEKPHTGKEIINRAIQDTDGKWSPSPGLIYPLLGRLLDEGIIVAESEHKNSQGDKKNIKYTLGKKGIETTNDIRKISKGIKDQIEVLCRIRDAGRFVAADMIECASSIGYMMMMTTTTTTTTTQNKDDYRQFLIDELDRLDYEEKHTKIDKKISDEKVDSQNDIQRIKVE